MIYINTIRDFSTETLEGKLLLAALSVLTTIDCQQIKSGKYGGTVHPDDALRKIVDLANYIYYEEEYKSYLESVKRQNKIEDIINKENHPV
jgi:hypothetical protein